MHLGCEMQPVRRGEVGAVVGREGMATRSHLCSPAVAATTELKDLLPGGRRGGWVGVTSCSLSHNGRVLQLVTPFATGVQIAPGSEGALSELAMRPLWR